MMACALNLVACDFVAGGLVMKMVCCSLVYLSCLLVGLLDDSHFLVCCSLGLLWVYAMPCLSLSLSLVACELVCFLWFQFQFQIGFGYMRQSMLCGFACGFACAFSFRLGHLLPWFVVGLRHALVCCGLGYLSTELVFDVFVAAVGSCSLFLRYFFDPKTFVAGRGCAGDFILLAGHLLGVAGRGCAGDFILLHHLLLCIVAERGCAGYKRWLGDVILLHHLLLAVVVLVTLTELTCI
ncbi:uncharacterized protein A4U43_C09F7760 [Asparagus officinalis]|uniref:Uncharacterized protein n=1 Tax=Asparagus officinalis TaxID=4686 RepID=A0A5P1EAV2_ASPOF|nr:uncharacterized protein A4U43_C09F7760 [Asparagus officinalis]